MTLLTDICAISDTLMAKMAINATFKAPNLSWSPFPAAVSVPSCFYPHPLRERGSTDWHFLLLFLLLFLQTSNFLFLLGTENAVGGVGLWQCMPSCLHWLQTSITQSFLKLEHFLRPFLKTRNHDSSAHTFGSSHIFLEVAQNGV